MEELIMVSKCELWFSGDGVWLPHPQEKHWRPEYTSIDTYISQIQKIQYFPTIWQILMGTNISQKENYGTLPFGIRQILTKKIYYELCKKYWRNTFSKFAKSIYKRQKAKYDNLGFIMRFLLLTLLSRET